MIKVHGYSGLARILPQKLIRSRDRGITVGYQVMGVTQPIALAQEVSMPRQT